MGSKFEVGQIIDGKVTGIQPYGAFIALDDETQGLVHISEITHGFVTDIQEHISVGDDVKVKVIEVNEDKNKVSLSIRQLMEAPKQESTQAKNEINNANGDNSGQGFNTLKDKLQEWLDQSENR